MGASVRAGAITETAVLLRCAEDPTLDHQESVQHDGTAKGLAVQVAAVIARLETPSDLPARGSVIDVTLADPPNVDVSLPTADDLTRAAFVAAVQAAERQARVQQLPADLQAQIAKDPTLAETL